jgi:hypothetical protein
MSHWQESNNKYKEERKTWVASKWMRPNASVDGLEVRMLRVLINHRPM